MTMVRVWEVLEASETARSAYLHIHSHPNLRPMAKNAICLLLWLETAMGFNILQSVTAMSPENISLTQVVYEANAMYTFVLFGYYSMPPAFQGGIPIIISLCNDAGGHRLVDFRFFMFHKELVARGVSVIRDTVARVVFDENLHAMLRRFEEDLANSSLIPNPVPAPELMAPFVASRRTPCEDSRTAFIAFPIGHTLTSEDIKNYFESVDLMLTFLKYDLFIEARKQLVLYLRLVLWLLASKSVMLLANGYADNPMVLC